MVSTKRKFELDFVSDFELTTEFDIRFAKISGYFNTKYWYLDITEIGMKTPLELAWKFPLNLVKLILISPKYWDLNGRTATSSSSPPPSQKLAFQNWSKLNITIQMASTSHLNCSQEKPINLNCVLFHWWNYRRK